MFSTMFLISIILAQTGHADELKAPSLLLFDLIHHSLVAHKLPFLHGWSFQCDICGKSYTFARNLRRHYEVHQYVKPHQCCYCFKTFTRSDSLKKHIDKRHVLD